MKKLALAIIVSLASFSAVAEQQPDIEFSGTIHCESPGKGGQTLDNAFENINQLTATTDLYKKDYPGMDCEIHYSGTIKLKT